MRSGNKQAKVLCQNVEVFLDKRDFGEKWTEKHVRMGVGEIW